MEAVFCNVRFKYPTREQLLSFLFPDSSALAALYLPYMMHVMYSWKLLRSLNILRRNLQQASPLDSLPFHGSFCD